MKNLFKAIGIVVAAQAVTGCSQDTISVADDTREEYVRNFITTFGIPDPDHNYAMAKSAGLQVVTEKGGHVTVTAMVGDTEYLFADLDVPVGTHALPVTIPASVSQLIVKTDRGVQTVATDATVDLDKSPAASRASVTDDFPVLYGGEYDIVASSNDGEMEMSEVENEHPYLYFSLSGVNKTFFVEKVLDHIGRDNTDYTYTLTEPDESTGEILRFNPTYPAPHETILTCQGSATYYIFPVYWKKDNAGYKDYEIVLHKANDGTNELNSPYIIPFANLGDDKSDNPFPYLGYLEESVSVPYYFYPYDNHVYDDTKSDSFLSAWEKIKFGGYTEKAFDSSKAKALISRGVKINLKTTNRYIPGVALSVRSRFSDGKPASFVSSAPFYNTHPDAWGENYYDVQLDNLYLASSATLRWGGEISIPYVLDNNIDVSEVEGYNNKSLNWVSYRNDLPFFLGFSTQPDRPASDDMRDYCDVILLVTPHKYISKQSTGEAGVDKTVGVYYRHMYTQLPDPMEWTLAAEDLGGSDDWDFNDVVFSFTDVIRNLKSANWLSSQAMISGPAGAGSVRKITIKPKATGGTMPIYITLTAKNVVDDIPDMPSDGETMFSVANAALKEAMGISDDDDTYHTYIIGQEVHKWLGASSYTQFVNVGASRQDIDAKEVEIVIPTDLDIGDEDYLAQQAGPSQDNKPLYGFGVLVDKDNVLKYDAFADGSNGLLMADNLVLGEDTYLIGAPSDDIEAKVPQMILVQGDWQWPTERTNILEAYPDFKAWVSDHTNSTWITTPNDGKVTRK